MMNFIKKLARGLSSYMFKLLILLVAVVAALVMTFHSPKKIEKSLSESGVYSTFVDSALQEIQKATSKEGSSGDKVPINDPAIKTAAQQAFTPQLLQQSTENVLDGTFDWLAGKTPTPNFKIDLTAAKQTFANAVGAAAAQRVTGLPECTVVQMQQLTADMDPFALACRPPGFDIAAAQSKVTNDIATSKEFLGTPVITPQTMPKNGQGKTIFEEANQAPKIYKWINASPWLLAILAVIAGGITMALYESRRRGLRNLAMSLAGTGIFLLFISYVNNRLFGQFSRPGGGLSKNLQGSFQQTGIKAASSIVHSILSVIMWFGIIYLVIGVASLLVLHFTKPKTDTNKKPDSKPEEPSTTPDEKTEPKAEEPQSPKPPKPRPRPLIQ